MKPSDFVFRESFTLEINYDTVAHHIREHLEKKYFKGFLGRNELQVFFLSGILKRTFSQRLPIIQVNVLNKSDVQGTVLVRFKMVDFVFILTGLIIVLLTFFSMVNLNPARYESLILLFLVLTFLHIYYFLERAAFKKDIARLAAKEKIYKATGDSES